MLEPFDREKVLGLKIGDRLVTEPLLKGLDPNEAVEWELVWVNKDKTRFRFNQLVWGQINLGMAEIDYRNPRVAEVLL